jgi:protein-S-isoprenylcysteine O-methyltransferase Ste14
MVDDSQDPRGPGTSVSDVANVGLVRPPLVYLGSIALGLALHLLWPARLLPTSLGMPLGVIVTLVAVALFVSAVRTLQGRNPIYLAFSLFQLGLSFWVDSLALLITLIPAVALMWLVVIPREERYLEARFPSEYLPYKASVRRWL